MLNLYETVRTNPTVNRLEIGDFLFSKHSCGIGDERIGLWAHTDYLVNVITGRKTWQTVDGTWEAKPGESLYFKKGAAIINQHFEVDFCLLMFFIPDGLIRSTVQEISASLEPLPADLEPMKTATRVENDIALFAFFQSMHIYFSGKERPSELILRLKLKELIISILTSGKNPVLAAYFRSLAESETTPLAETMENNYRYNLSQEEYARLCHRSLSSFKRDFQAHYQEPPGKWLLRKRLEHAAALLRNSKLNVTEIGLESGFEDVSHFSRVFKEKFNVPPLAYRQAGSAQQ